jgi:hypothetical protein
MMFPLLISKGIIGERLPHLVQLCCASHGDRTCLSMAMEMAFRLQKKEARMYLHDILQVCLLALNARYPDHTLDIDACTCGLKYHPCKSCSASQAIMYFQEQAPHLLSEAASLYITGDRCAIFLHSRPLVAPIIMIHCRGRIPVH